MQILVQILSQKMEMTIAKNYIVIKIEAVQIELPADITDKISDRCIRCYNEQYWYGENYLFDLIKERDLKKTKILEIGCAEGGLLKFFHERVRSAQALSSLMSGMAMQLC